MIAWRFWMLVLLATLGSVARGWAQHAWVKEYFDFEKKILKYEYQVLPSDPKKLNGLFISYYADGTVQSKGRYVSGFQDSKWTYYFQNGNKKSSGGYTVGHKTGHWEYFYESGKLSQAGKMEDGKKFGIWQYYFESGGMKSEGEFLADKNNGLWKYYREDGGLKATAAFSKGKGQYEERYDNGSLKMVGQIRDGGSDSVWAYYYDTGTKKAEGHEKNGLKMGRWRFYHPDGSLMSEGEFLADQEYGEWVYYYPNGQISSKGKMEGGKKEGNWNLFYETGKFMGEATFDKGYGKYKEFYDNGKVKMTGFIAGNTYIGEWKYYYDDGQLEGECLYINGEGDYMGYYPDGSKKISGRLKNGQKIGVWRLYDPEGKLSGLYKSYFETGSTEPMIDTSKMAEKPVALATRKKKASLILPGKQLHFFKPKINEVRGIIVGINPVAVFLNQLPISAEYYMDKRLGYEIGVNILRKPFLERHSDFLNTFNNSTIYQGLGVFARQKLYFGKRGPGDWYFAQEIRYTYTEYEESDRHLLQDSLRTFYTEIVNATEQKVEFSLLIGHRFFVDFGRSSLCFDLFGGVGVGYRRLQNNNSSDYFKEVPMNPVTVPVRLGAMVGYLF